MKLTSLQKQILAEFLANLAIVWIAAGIITPIFDQTNTFNKQVIYNISTAMLASATLIGISLKVAKEKA